VSERLVYVRMDDERGELIVQLDGGGAMQKFGRGMCVEQVVSHLRTLAWLLESGAQQRQEQRPPAPEGNS
jgi:hypothetical protein